MADQLEPDRDQLEQFYDATFRHAGDEGFVSLRVFTQADRKPLFQKLWKAPVKHPRNVIDVATDNARRAANNEPAAQFAPPICVLKPEARWQARESDVLLGLVISVECDENPNDARMALEKILGPATVIVKSGGTWINGGDVREDKLHLHWRLAKPTRAVQEHGKLKRARELAARIVGADKSSVPIVHPMRWPGSWHRKDKPRRCEIVSLNPDQEIDLEAAIAVLEAVAPPEAAKPERQDDAGPADWRFAPDDLLDHDKLAALAMRLVRSGMDKGACVNLLKQNVFVLTGVDEERRKRRLHEIPDMVDSAAAKIEAPPLDVEPCSLAEVVLVIRKRLALKNNNAVYAVLGTIAANLLPGRDPVWLGLIGPPSTAKTELINSTSLLTYVQTVETFTPAGLLSGSPRDKRAKDATGGVLHKIGKFGILAIKDFSTVIELRHEQRSEMMAALRRIYDGEYTRTLGTEGGRTIKWSGKAGLVFGATQAYDAHHAVSGTLGDRPLLLRVEAMQEEQLETSFIDDGAADIRNPIAKAVAGLFAGLAKDQKPQRMSREEYALLKNVVRLAVRIRAGVMRDGYRREIADVHDPEGPARLAISLQQLFSGVILIGVNRAEALDLVRKIALDSVPRIRLAAYYALTDDWQTTREVANAVRLPNTTTLRALEELTAQGVALRDYAKGEGEAEAEPDLLDKGWKGKEKKPKSTGAHRWKLAIPKTT
jgi:hypothetical protein